MPLPTSSARGAKRSRHPVATSPAACGHPPLTLALSVAAAFSLPAAALAQSTGLQAIQGTASVVTQGNKTVITTQNGAGTSHSALNWQSFGVAPGTTTQFNQPSAASTSINRVLGNNPSAIFGTLSSNGRLVLVNPAGIAVGAGAVVDTAGFTASTLRMTDADALAGRLVFGDGALAGSLSVNGHIVARGGDIVLISPDVQTGAGAVIESPNGTTILAAGRKVEVTGRGLEGIRLEVQAPTDQAVNLGQLKGDAVGIFAGTLKHSGLIQATAVSVEGGKVVLKGTQEAEVSGTVTAQKGSLGGQIHATAAKVKLKSGAVIDASGAAGGGEVLIGGGWQGQDARVTNASQTTAEAGATINADATQQGNGGTVVLWSDDATRTQATITARGGVQGGHGGKLETSGKRFLDATVAPQLNARATGWSGGDWLLDPYELIVGTGSPAAPSPVANEYTGFNSNSSSYVPAATINTALSLGTSVTLQTSGGASAPSQNEVRIRVSENITKSAGTAATLKLVAHENVQVDNGVTIGSIGGPLNIEFKSGYSASDTIASSTGGSIILGTGATLNSNGGTISLTGIATGSTALEAVQATQAVLTSGGGAITLNGTHGSVNRRGVYLDRTTINSGGGAITLGSTTSNIRIEGSSLVSGSGGVTISAVGAHNYSALEIVDSAGPPSIPSLVSANSGGAISLTGEQTGGGFSAGSYAGGVVISNSTVSSFNGSVTLVGKVGVPSGVAQVSRGFSLETGARITSNGVVSLTGEVGASASANSHGGVLASGATVSSTGGGVSLSGTLNNASISAGTGLTIGGRVQSSGLTSLNGSATVGNSSGTGLDIQFGAVISSSALGVTATGSVSSSTTATNLVAASISGTISTTSAINVTGAISAPSAVNASGVVISGGVITGTNSGNQINITGSGVPAPAPASSRSIYIQGGTVSSTGGQVKLAGDRLEIAGVVNSSTGRTMIVPTSTNRAIVLAGSDEFNALNLTSSEINSITASALVIGGGTFNGGININGNIAPANTNTLSLINEPTGANGIAQAVSTSITVNNLNADARYVSLAEAGNSISNVAGRNYAGTFGVRSSGAMTINTVDGTAGLIASTTGGITVQAGGVITINGDIYATSSSATLTGGGITLNSTRTINAGGVSLNAGGGVMSLGLGSLTASGTVQLSNAATTTLGAISALAGDLVLDNISGGIVQQVGSSVAAGLLRGSGNAGVINLSNSGNNFISIGTLSTSGGGLTVVDGSANLNISGVVSAPNGIINIRTPGGISQSHQVNSGAAGDSIVLSAGTNYFNTAGSTGLLATHGSGRWLVYASSPSGNNFGSLASGNSAVWNSPYATNLPNTIAAGNRYVFANQPTANITANAQSREYDGNTMFAPVTHTVSGLVDASLYGNVFSQDILTGSLAVTAPGRNVGTYAIGIGTLTAPTGYLVNYTPANATVTPKALTINAVTDSRVYNGDVTSSAVPTYVGLVAGDTLTGLTQSYASKNVLGANGSTLQVNGGYVLDDSNGGSNYTVTPIPVSGTITPAALTVSTSSVNRQYDSTVNAAGTPIHTTGTLYSGDTLSGGTFAFVSKNVGTNVTVNASGITVDDGNSGNNYTLTHVANNTSNITAAPLSVTGVTAANRVYDGTAVATLGGSATVLGLGGDDVSISGTGAGTFANKHVGTGKAVTVTGFGLSGTDAGNYLIVQPAGVTADITQRAISVMPNDVTRVYDGTVNATSSLLVTSGSLALGDSPVGGTFSFADRHAGAGKTVNISGLSINDGNSGNNYLLTLQPNTSSTITQANLNVTGVTASSRNYDGTTVASLGGSATVAALGGDSISLTGTAVGSFANKHAGNTKPVSVSGYSLSGTHAGNYVLVQPSGLSADITPAPLTISTSSVNKVYDTTTNAAGSAIVTGGALFVTDTISGGTFQFASKNAGTNVTVNVSGVTVNDDNSGNNYAVTYAANNTSNIAQASLNVTGVTANSRVYDGTTFAGLGGTASVTGLGGDVVSVLGTGTGFFADRHVGSAKPVTVTGYSLTGTDAGNYAVVQPTGVTANITPANLNVTGVTAVSKVYDATTVATLGGSATVSGFGGDVVSVTGTGIGAFANKNVQAGQAGHGQRLFAHRRRSGQLHDRATHGRHGRHHAGVADGHGPERREPRVQRHRHRSPERHRQPERRAGTGCGDAAEHGQRHL
jgi:filamentous hemagglutinin family protein